MDINRTPVINQLSLKITLITLSDVRTDLSPRDRKRAKVYLAEWDRPQDN